MVEWFEKLGFGHNPFIIDPMLNDFELFDRKEELAEILYRINSSSMLFIEGDEGVGKTILLRKAIEQFRGRIIYVNCRNVRKQLNIESLLINKWGFIRGRVLGNMPNQMILMLDNVSELSRINSERIKYFYDSDHLKSVIFTGAKFEDTSFSPSLKQRIGKRVLRLKPLSEDSAVEMVLARVGEGYALDRALIKKVYAVSQKNPKMLLKNLTVLFSHAAAKDKDISMIDVERTINQKIDDLDFGDEEHARGTDGCERCGTKLTMIGDSWRCENCDTACGNCGTIVDDEQERICPGCGAEFAD